MSQNGQTHFKNLIAFVVRFLKCVWLFWDILDEKIKTVGDTWKLKAFNQFRVRSLYVRDTAQKMKFSIKDLFSKCDRIHSLLQIWSHSLKKSLMKNFIFCAVKAISVSQSQRNPLFQGIPTQTSFSLHSTFRCNWIS